MEEGWILDSFAKNDLFIDRAFKAYLIFMNMKFLNRIVVNYN